MVAFPAFFPRIVTLFPSAERMAATFSSEVVHFTCADALFRVIVFFFPAVTVSVFAESVGAAAWAVMGPSPFTKSAGISPAGRPHRHSTSRRTGRKRLINLPHRLEILSVVIILFCSSSICLISGQQHIPRAVSHTAGQKGSIC